MTQTSLLEWTVMAGAFGTMIMVYLYVFDAILTYRAADDHSAWLRWVPSVREASTLTTLSPHLVMVALFVSSVGIYLLLAQLQGTTFGAGVVIVLLVAFFASFRPLATLNRKRYLAKFETQLPIVIDQMVAQLRGSRTLQTGFRELPSVLPEPAAGEIFEITDRAQRGLGLQSALVAAGKKYDSRNYLLLLAIFRIFDRQGGNVVDPLQKMSAAYKEIIKIDEAIRTASTQARVMFYIINGAILFIFIFVSSAQPQMIEDIFSNIVNIILFFIGLSIYVAGAIFMWRMMKVDV